MKRKSPQGDLRQEACRTYPVLLRCLQESDGELKRNNTRRQHKRKLETKNIKNSNNNNNNARKEESDGEFDLDAPDFFEYAQRLAGRRAVQPASLLKSIWG